MSNTSKKKTTKKSTTTKKTTNKKAVISSVKTAKVETLAVEINVAKKDAIASEVNPTPVVIESQKAPKVKKTTYLDGCKATEMIIHCSATPKGVPFSAKDIDTWHKARGWAGIGYHFVIRADGSIETGRRLNQIGAHTKGKNKGTIGICYIGGLDKGKSIDTRTDAQKESMLMLVTEAKALGMKISGHNEYSTKACPCFDVREEYK